MATITVGRKARGAKAIQGTKKAAMFGAAATTAVAIAMGTTTLRTRVRLPSTFDATSTGPLFWLVNQLGVDTVTIPGVPVLGDLTINLDFAAATQSTSTTRSTPTRSAASSPTRLREPIFWRPAAPPPARSSWRWARAPPMPFEAYQAMLASANGNTPAGYTALTPAGRSTRSEIRANRVSDATRAPIRPTCRW